MIERNRSKLDKDFKNEIEYDSIMNINIAIIFIIAFKLKHIN